MCWLGLNFNKKIDTYIDFINKGDLGLDKKLLEMFKNILEENFTEDDLNNIEKLKKEFKDKKIKSAMDILQEKNQITVETIINDPSWLLLMLRRYLTENNAKIYCVQMRCKDGHSAMYKALRTTLEESIQDAVKIQEEDTENMFELVQADLLFK